MRTNNVVLMDDIYRRVKDKDWYRLIQIQFVLRSACIDVNLNIGSSIKTPLQLAAEYGDVPLLACLLKAGFDVNAEYHPAPTQYKAIRDESIVVFTRSLLWSGVLAFCLYLESRGAAFPDEMSKCEQLAKWPIKPFYSPQYSETSVLFKVITSFLLSWLMAVLAISSLLPFLNLYVTLRQEKHKRKYFIERQHDTPILLAAKNNHAEAVCFLLEKGAKTYELKQYVEAPHNNTLLHRAVLNEAILLIHLLVTYKAVPLIDVNARNQQGYTARELAVQKNKLVVLRYLATYSDIKPRFGLADEKKSYPELIWLLLVNQPQIAPRAQAVLDPKLVLFTLFRLSAVSTKHRKDHQSARQLPPELWRRIAAFYFQDNYPQQVKQFQQLVIALQSAIDQPTAYISNDGSSLVSEGHWFEKICDSIGALGSHSDTYLRCASASL